MTPFLFALIFCSFAVLFSILIVSSKNPIHSILYLILVFCNVSFVFILLDIEFIAIIFLIVYVGAIAVLFLFVVMMLNIKIVELSGIFWRYALLGLGITLLFLSELFFVLFNNQIYPRFEDFFYVKTLVFDYNLVSPSPLFAIIKSKDSFNYILGFSYTFSNTELLGWYVYTYGVYIFFLLGLILLVAMVGSIVLVLNQNVNVRRQFIFKQVLKELKSSVILKN